MNGTMFAYAGTIMLVLGGGEMMARPSSPPAPIEVSGCHAIDGDTLRCGRVRIRLLGIDAAEQPGHCRHGRQCAPGDPRAQRAALQRFSSTKLTVTPIKTDRWGRMVAVVRTTSGENLSCLMLRAGASYVARWDDRDTILRSCRSAVREANHL